MKYCVLTAFLTLMLFSTTALAADNNEPTDWEGIWLFIKVVAILICGWLILVNGCTHPTSIFIISVFLILWALNIVTTTDIGIAISIVVLLIAVPFFVPKGK